ncbi:MAG: GntR family transcriptional regulator [Gaiellales bacterium]
MSEGEHPDGDQSLTMVELRTVEQVVTARLRKAIITGALKPGERLAYRDLAHRFGVSVTPIRIAIRELANEGIVELKPHTGARVSPLSTDELEEIFSLRVGIEGWLALHGAPRLAAEDDREMNAILDKARAAEKRQDPEAYLRSSWALRMTCYRAAGKPRLLERLQSLYDHSTRYHFLTIAEVYRFKRSLAYLEEFEASCERRDGVGAQRTIQDAQYWTLAYLTEAMENAESSKLEDVTHSG